MSHDDDRDEYDVWGDVELDDGTTASREVWDPDHVRELDRQSTRTIETGVPCIVTDCRDRPVRRSTRSGGVELDPHDAGDTVEIRVGGQ